MTDDVGVLLVHGLCHGGWAWDGVRRELGDGVATAAPDLPMTDLADDVAEVRRALDEFGRPVVLVGHSYGGAVITGAGDHRYVRHLVYLAALQLDVGESMARPLPGLTVPATGLRAALRPTPDGEWVGFDPTLAAGLLYPDAPEPVAAAAVARLRPVRRSVFGGVPEVIGWRGVPSTYLVCGADRVLHPDLQRAMARRATAGHEWPVGHSPALTHPAMVAGLLADILAGTRQAPPA